MRRNLKLSDRYYRPYKIIQNVGSVAYRVDLPPGSQIHPVFHVSQLKCRVGPDITPQWQPPACDSDWRILIQPEAIVQRKMVMVNNAVGVKVLVKWANLGDDAATWEDWGYIRSQFSTFVAQLRPWEQGRFERGGFVSRRVKKKTGLKKYRR